MKKFIHQKDLDGTCRILSFRLLESIIKLEIMTEEEVKEALEGGENARLRIDYANK